MSYRANVYTALVSRLSTYTDLIDLLPSYNGDKAIFDHVPQDFKDSYPYVVIQNMDITQLGTDETNGFDAVITIHTWSDSRDIQELSDVMYQIKLALDRYSLDITGYSTSSLMQEFETVFRDPDEITRHGIQRYRLFFEPKIDYICS